MKAKVLSEKYQIAYQVETADGHKPVFENVEYKDAYWRAFQVAGALRCRVDIQRITTVETPAEVKGTLMLFIEGVGDEVTQVITGQVTIDAEHFSRDTQLSRYNPVNGWVIPEHINNFEDAALL